MSRWLLNHFDPFWGCVGPYWDHFGTKIGPFLGDFWVILDHFWVDPGSLWLHLGIILESFWCRFDPILRPFLALFELFLDHFWAILSRFWGRFYGHFAIFFVMFWEVECNIQQNDAREGKTMQTSAKIHQIYAKLCKNKLFFSALKHLFCLTKTVKIDVSTYESVQ